MAHNFAILEGGVAGRILDIMDAPEIADYRMLNIPFLNMFCTPIRAHLALTTSVDHWEMHTNPVSSL